MATAAPKYPKLPEEIENEKEIIEALKKLTPLPLKLKGFALNTHTLKLKEIGTEEEEEIEKINAETQRNFQVHLKNINDLINGTRAPTEEELKELESYVSAEEKAQLATVTASLKPLPEYWLTVLKNDPVIKVHINENDEKAIKSLTRLEYKLSEDTANPHNFSIIAHFQANEYFDNEVLTAYFTMREPRDVLKSEGTQIQWKAGKDTTKKMVSKKQKNKKTGQTRTVQKEETIPSFFNLFKSITAPDEEKELDEDEEQLQNEILDQIDIAYSLIEEAIPFSLEYFLGVRKDYLGEDDGDDEDFDDEDDDDEDEAPKVKAKGGKGGKAGGAGAAGAAGAEGKQECKQQ